MTAALPHCEPFVTVLIRSFKRRQTLLELLGRLRDQAYPRFEIVICDQSKDAVLDRDVHALEDPRIRLFGYSPLGPAGARKFDPRAVAVRRTDIDGGCARRARTGWVTHELSARLLYFHRIVAHYCPLRFWLLYPLFLIWILARLLSWVWEPDNRHIGPLERVSASLTAVAAFPWLVVRRGWFAPVRGLRRVRSIPRPA